MPSVRFAAGATRIEIVLMLALALPVVAQARTQVRIEPQRSGVDVRLRGISAVDADIAWASGRAGTVLRTRDGGVTWENVSVPGAEQLDFRDVEAFDADHAVVLSIGNGAASRIYRTANGGRNWILVLHNGDERAFFDCMAFDGARGWMLGDPVDGRFQIHATHDGGRRWTLLPDGPQAAAGEAAFAASGTCIARGEGTLLVGGSGPARLHVKGDGDDAWRTVDSGMSRNKSEAGVFSIAAVGQDAVVVGGDYTAERLPGNATLWSAADGTSVQVLAPPRGYRSGVACAGSTQACVVVGPAGVDAWNGEIWTPVTDTGYDAIDLAGNTGWANGDGGRIARIAIGD
jgi:photosystem II stability/assembly factor-like uncharacterized protein